MKRRHVLLGALVAALTATSALQAAEPKAGDLVVRDAWARATPPGAGVAAVYLTVVGGSQADRLLAASTDVAAMTQVHEVTESQGMSRMRETAGVDIPAHKTVPLAPQGRHLMLMNLTRPLVAGDRFEVELTFERAGTRVVPVAVVAPDQSAPPAH